jgi:CRISPR/Cas system-associated exonuclease Cas4 (RecB family)
MSKPNGHAPDFSFPGPATAPAQAPQIYTAPVEPPAVLSPSQVNTFLECPAKWYYRYMLELPEPVTSSLALGRAVDEALSYNFRWKAETREDLPASDVLQAFDCAFAEQMAEAQLAEGESAEHLHELGEQLVSRYLVELAPDVQPAMVERDGEKTPAVQVPVRGEIAGVPVQGIIDLITEDGVVVDLKTASQKLPGIPPDYRLQLATYCRLTGHTQGRLDCMVKTKTVQCHRLSTEIGAADHRYLEAIYPAAQEAMRTGVYLPRRSSWMCSRKNCAFWRQCEADYGGTVKS